MIALFPEADYPAPQHLSQRYQESMTNGYSQMKQTGVAICGLARNIAGILPTTIARIERLGSLFQWYQVIVYENDSTDATQQLLQEWAQRNARVFVLSEQLGRPVNPGVRCLDRAQRMADARNKYLDALRLLPDDRRAPYTIIVDMDLLGGWSYDGIAHTFSRRGWDMVGSNGIMHLLNPSKKLNRKVQFDAWAFRPKGKKEPQRSSDVNPLWFNRGEPLIPMESCFGGLGCYRTEAMLRSKYDGGDCEHVPFHLGIQGNIFLNPSQIVDYGQRDW